MKEESILKSAKKLFSKYGFKKVSMDEIAKDAGVTKKTVYSYFSSKEELLNTIINEELTKTRSEIESLQNVHEDFFESIHQEIYRLLKIRRKNTFFKIIIEESEILKNESLKKSLNMVEKNIMEYIKERLQYAVNEGYIEILDIDIMTFLIYKMYLALTIDWNDKYKKLNEKEIADNIMQILKKGIIRKDVE